MTRDTSRIITKLRQRGKLPQNAGVRSIEKSDWPEIIGLHRLLFDISNEEFALRMKTGGEGIRYCNRLSVVLEYDGNCLGTCLFLPMESDKTAWLFGAIVAPSWRRTWATVVLKHAAFNRAAKQGVEAIAFQAFNDHPDTLNHAARVLAERLP
ncbi:GNAT family N-acetyltransferase [Ruegeria sediminis]|uniref:GNAT family N-acetyltransferase n=1 Tax=Ruegeria sediminis TaxID=2583820 RepID=UPI001C558775|nr:GNAT family N-acetyltransferase [Ruegeria sediminis]